MDKTYILYCILFFGFTLGIFRGQLALWEDGQAQPVKVFPLYADTLPAEDRQRLETGLRAENQAALTALLEDYLS